MKSRRKTVNRVCMLTTAAVFAAGSALYAQPPAAPTTPPPPATEATVLKRSYNSIKTNLTKAADRMPEDQYGFQASPDIRTFGALIGHIADVQGGTCARVAGSPAPPSAGKMTAKADLVAALKASFDVCDTVFNGLTDADAGKMVPSGRGGATSSEFATLWGLIIGHSNEEYGYLSVYMRLKGIVPPSTQP
jgi:DinB superfamily